MDELLISSIVGIEAEIEESIDLRQYFFSPFAQWLFCMITKLIWATKIDCVIMCLCVCEVFDWWLQGLKFRGMWDVRV